jgi:hypothetical protein
MLPAGEVHQVEDGMKSRINPRSYAEPMKRTLVFPWFLSYFSDAQIQPDRLISELQLCENGVSARTISELF